VGVLKQLAIKVVGSVPFVDASDEPQHHQTRVAGPGKAISNLDLGVQRKHVVCFLTPPCTVSGTDSTLIASQSPGNWTPARRPGKPMRWALCVCCLLCTKECLSQTLLFTDSSHFIQQTTPPKPPERCASKPERRLTCIALAFRRQEDEQFPLVPMPRRRGLRPCRVDHSDGKSWGFWARERRARIRQEPASSHHQHARGSASADRGPGDLGLWDAGSSSRAWIRLRLDRGLRLATWGGQPPATKASCEKRSP
jgi:hypothetical protein